MALLRREIGQPHEKKELHLDARWAWGCARWARSWGPGRDTHARLPAPGAWPGGSSSKPSQKVPAAGCAYVCAPECASPCPRACEPARVSVGSARSGSCGFTCSPRRPGTCSSSELWVPPPRPPGLAWERDRTESPGHWLSLFGSLRGHRGGPAPAGRGRKPPRAGPRPASGRSSPRAPGLRAAVTCSGSAWSCQRPPPRPPPAGAGGVVGPEAWPHLAGLGAALGARAAAELGREAPQPRSPPWSS